MNIPPTILPNHVYLDALYFDTTDPWVMPIGGAGIRWTIALADYDLPSTGTIQVRTITATTVSAWVPYLTLSESPPVFDITTGEGLQYGLALDVAPNAISFTASPAWVSKAAGAVIVDRTTHIDIIQGTETVSVPKVTVS